MSQFVLGHQPPPEVLAAESRFISFISPYHSGSNYDATHRCQRWTGTAKKAGLPYFFFSGRAWPIHRFAYLCWVDALDRKTPDGTSLLPRPLLCPLVDDYDPLCVNPYHLILVPPRFRADPKSLLELFAVYDLLLDNDEDRGLDRGEEPSRPRLFHKERSPHLVGHYLPIRIDERHRLARFRIGQLRDILEVRKNRAAQALRDQARAAEWAEHHRNIATIMAEAEEP